MRLSIRQKGCVVWPSDAVDGNPGRKDLDQVISWGRRNSNPKYSFKQLRKLRINDERSELRIVFRLRSVEGVFKLQRDDDFINQRFTQSRNLTEWSVVEFVVVISS